MALHIKACGCASLQRLLFLFLVVFVVKEATKPLQPFSSCFGALVSVNCDDTTAATVVIRVALKLFC